MSTMELSVHDAPEERRMPPMTIAQSIGAVLAGLAAILVCAFVFVLKPVLGEETTQLVHYVLALGLAVVFAGMIRGLPIARASFDLCVPPASTWLPLALGSVGLLLGVAGPIVSMIPVSDELAKTFADLVGQTGIAPMLTFVVAAPMLEELLFRGVILDGLLRKYSARTAILVSSLLFGIMHMNHAPRRRSGWMRAETS